MSAGTTAYVLLVCQREQILNGTNRKQFKMLLIFLFLSFLKIFVAFPFSHFFLFQSILGEKLNLPRSKGGKTSTKILLWCA